MIFSFYKLSGTYKYADFEAMEEEEIGPRLKQFVKAKHYLSLALFVVFIVLGLQSFHRMGHSRPSSTLNLPI
jgi:hypothetical protein